MYAYSWKTKSLTKKRLEEKKKRKTFKMLKQVAEKGRRGAKGRSADEIATLLPCEYKGTSWIHKGGESILKPST